MQPICSISSLNAITQCPASVKKGQILSYNAGLCHAQLLLRIVQPTAKINEQHLFVGLTVRNALVSHLQV